MKALKWVLIGSFVCLLATGLISFTIVEKFFVYDLVKYCQIKDTMQLIMIISSGVVFITGGTMILLTLKDFKHHNGL